MSAPNTHELVLPPREAATLLGVAPSTLRRLATVYTDVFGADALGWSDGGRGGGSRLWTGEALRRTRAARELVESGRASSFELALRTLKDSPESALTLTVAEPETGPEVAALRDEVAVLREALEELRDELAALKVLPSPAEGERVETPSETLVPDGQAEGEHPQDELRAVEESTPDGVFVKAARWLERLLRR